MTTPEQRLFRQRRQLLHDETTEGRQPQTPEQEDSWVGDFITRLAGALRGGSGKR